MNWKEELKKEEPYAYGRCQIQNGEGCIRPLKSPKVRSKAGSKPNGNICMHCEDDTSRWAIVPKGNLSSSELDTYSHKHPNAWRKLHEVAQAPYW